MAINTNPLVASAKALTERPKCCHLALAALVGPETGRYQTEHVSLVWTPRVIVRCKYVNITRRITNMFGMSEMMRVTASTSRDALEKTKETIDNLSKRPGHLIVCRSWTS